VGGRAGVDADEGKEGPVARRYGEYVCCKVCQTISLDVGVSRCGPSSGQRITSRVRTASSRAALYRIELRQYDLLVTRSAPKFV
jgi:hypothetical protein